MQANIGAEESTLKAIQPQTQPLQAMLSRRNVSQSDLMREEHELHVRHLCRDDPHRGRLFE